jgi:hypothetical protein
MMPAWERAARNGFNPDKSGEKSSFREISITRTATIKRAKTAVFGRRGLSFPTMLATIREILFWLKVLYGPSSPD